MSTVPPMHAVRKKLAQWLTEPKEFESHVRALTPAQREVSQWLMGDKARLDTLIGLLHARIEGRGSMPFPSNPHDAVVRLAADAEARMIIAELTSIATQPVINPGIEESQ